MLISYGKGWLVFVFVKKKKKEDAFPQEAPGRRELSLNPIPSGVHC